MLESNAHDPVEGINAAHLDRSRSSISAVTTKIPAFVLSKHPVSFDVLDYAFLVGLARSCQSMSTMHFATDAHSYSLNRIYSSSLITLSADAISSSNASTLLKFYQRHYMIHSILV